jgi:cell division protease FtsH
VLDNLVLALMEKETLSKEEVLEIFAPVEKRPSRGSWTGTGKRRPSDKPPVTTPAELASINGNGPHSNGSNGHVPDLQKQPSGQAPSGTPSAPPAGPPSGTTQGNWPPPSPASGGWNPPPSGGNG